MLCCWALLFSVSAADAECLSVEVRYWTYGSNTPHYVVGPKKCVAPTPWQVNFYDSYDDRFGPLPPGTPNGVGYSVWIPLP
jgi:hypothetical protein